MATYIHTRRVKHGVLYRIWNTDTGSYITPPMSEADIISWTRNEAIRKAVQEYSKEIQEKLERAVKTGTSSLVERRKNLEEWNLELLTEEE